MKTIFLRVLEAPVDDKADTLRAAAQAPGIARFELDPLSFSVVPGVPFAYWLSDKLRRRFLDHVSFESQERTARNGLQTGDDDRWLRLWWEACSGACDQVLVPFAKGGAYSPFYCDLSSAVRWGTDGRWIKEWKADRLRRGEITANNSKCWNEEFYLRPGLTWPLRASRFAPHPLPRGSIFSIRGYSAFVPPAERMASLAVFCSAPFDYLFKTALGRHGFPEFVVGVLKRLPWPELGGGRGVELGNLARRAWSLKRSLDTRNETSHAFALPALLQGQRPTLAEAAFAWAERVQATEAELAEIQAEIDDRCFDLYGIGEDDRRAITQGFGASTTDEEEAEPDEDDDDTEEVAADTASLAEELFSWTMGVAFGRFDVRLATGERALPPEPEPFDPLPVCSPGMLTGEDGLPLAKPPEGYPIAFPEDGVLVDDVGHPRDVMTAIRHVFDVAFRDQADAWWRDVSALLDPKDHDLRAYLAARFFEPHLKRYSKSRRKAPIYWQLATPSARYSVWLYAHRLTKDTFFHLLNDVVGPKLAHEELRLTSLHRDAGTTPSPSQRREIEPLESLVDELRAMRADLERVAPLWNPNLDDGIVLVMAPLWRLVPQHKGWQKELRTKWDELCEGKYDWAHLAMHLWPERVVPKCADDRSLAIAHGLEDELWVEGGDGKWKKREVEPERIEALIAERTSPAVKAALAALLSAPTAKSTGTKKRGARRRRATPIPPRPDKTLAGVDESTLAAIRTAIASAPGGASKADVLESTGLSPSEWTRAITILLERGEVTQSGQKRGTRYHVLVTGDRAHLGSEEDP